MLAASTDAAATVAPADVAVAGITPADGRALRFSEPGASCPQIGNSRTERMPSRPVGST
jgi:hypothetical protein